MMRCRVETQSRSVVELLWPQLGPRGMIEVSSDFVASIDGRAVDAAVPIVQEHDHFDQPVGGIRKRVLDILIATAVLILSAPLFLLIAALIKLTMGGPVFFAHTRIGYRRRSFRCFKFRTMVDIPEERIARYFAENPDCAREWRASQKLKSDFRVTPLGRILRKLSLDELPQLVNVLRGEMSCVGPRPVLATELYRYGAHAHEYARVRPGMTGLWQVSGRNQVSYRKRVALDRYYVRRWSIALDFIVLVRTVPVLLCWDQTS
jgi:exopolysaccharide production protein ExoY